ncbi:hypothetical protein Daus18300_012206 [Diaporthe australafricana]|uniref:FAD-binding domain-containing protein n=1 Tax=Diaporthe australafricana TaxID=127596 RepID=A0ABR3W3S5_9PEZI
MPQVARSLNVLVVGGGLGGLAAALALQTDGHLVRVIDAVPAFVEAGAGIRVPPNSSRLLMRWGIDVEGMKKSSLSCYRFVRWQDGSTMVKLPFEDIVETHGAPYYLVHRADLHAALLEAAQNAGVEILNNKRVVSYDFETPSATTQDDEVFAADLVICADGIKSLAQKLLADDDLAELINDPCSTSWCGPDAHLVGYPIRNGEMYNVVVCATSYNETTDEVWVVKGDNRELCSRFSQWEPRVRKLCALTGEFMKWRLCDLPTLTRWVHRSGKAVLLGDSCHPMLPYLAQGAAQSFEDAAALRQCLALGMTLNESLKLYEDIRMPRASLIQAKTREHQHILHIDDGAEQRMRDEKMKINNEQNPIFWGYDDRRKWLFSHDAEVLNHTEVG